MVLQQKEAYNQYPRCRCGTKIPAGYKLCPACTERQILSNNNQGRQTVANKNSGLVIALIVVILVGLAVAVAGYFLINSDNTERQPHGNGTQNDPATVVDGPETEPEPEVNTVSSYKVVFSDTPNRLMSWDQAKREASSEGGQIVCVNSYEEFLEVCRIADEAELYMFWLGARRGSGQSWENARWLDGSQLDFTKWLANEPSYSFEGEEERYLMAVKNGDEWYFNDSFGDVTDVYDIERYQYRIACIVEIKE